MYYINLFFIYSIFGYILESLLAFSFRKNYNSGILYGPWTPIYGFAVLIMIIVFLFIKKFNYKNFKEKVVYFIFITIFLTFLEGVGGYLIQLIFKKTYWNYDKLLFNIGHFMSLEISLIWGILAIISMYYIVPKISNLIKKIPKTLTFIILSLFVIDVIISNFK